MPRVVTRRSGLRRVCGALFRSFVLVAAIFASSLVGLPVIDDAAAARNARPAATWGHSWGGGWNYSNGWNYYRGSYKKHYSYKKAEWHGKPAWGKDLCHTHYDKRGKGEYKHKHRYSSKHGWYRSWKYHGRKHQSCEPEPPKVECQECGCQACDGGLSSVTIRYDGDKAAVIKVFDKYWNQLVRSTMVEPGEEIAIQHPNGNPDVDGAGGFCPVVDDHGNPLHRKKLSEKLRVYVNGHFNTKIYTDCGQHNAPGTQRGSFTISDAISVKGGSLCPVNGDCKACRGGVTDLTLRYTGESIADIEIVDANDHVLYSGDKVAAETDVVIAGSKGKPIVGPIKIRVDGKSNAVLLTDCSTPVGPGTVWGDFQVREATSKDNGAICGCLKDEPEPDPDPVLADRGDAPASYGQPTHSVLAANNPYIGNIEPDTETSNPETSNASGDDTTGIDDEGVSIDTDTSESEVSLCRDSLFAGESYTMVTRLSGVGFFNVWLDFNNNGRFDNGGEQIAVDIASDGTQNQRIAIPFTTRQNGASSFARFRFSSQPGLGPDGPAPDGEVEDCRFTITNP